MYKILVTGGAGYIGDEVVRQLHKPPYSYVTVLDNLMYGGSYMRRVPFIRADITDYPKMRDIMSVGCYDAVVHLAAIVGDGACKVNPGRTIEVNQIAVETLADLCKKYSSRLVFASTCSVYGKNNNTLTENSPTNPLSIYASTKLEAEKYITSVLDDYVIFRLGTLFGMSAEHARIRADLVANILTYRAAQGETLTVFGGNQWRPLLHVRDAADGFVKATQVDVHSFPAGTYVLAAENRTILSLAKEIVDVVGRGSIEKTPMNFEDERNYKVSIDKLRQTEEYKDWKFRTVGDGVAEMATTIREGRISDVWSPEFHNAKFVGAKYG